ncbi:phosphodiester glycosidase family protein [Paenibacillus glacialis]|uniref:Exopolysaccharide biosynthesis protein n=1 Tax=Paenibacillus glacialis TaxID=494026 RepID=A0A168NPV3_9BACL|nr:phosphodiester glycosidase family protein [Paenibacillus glacialis]OAB46012.1 exopolysaccharide biosynthesis protein [Paenibacillus glacialis]
MRLQVKQVNRFFLLATAPFIGILFCLMLPHRSVELNMNTSSYIPSESIHESSQDIVLQLNDAQEVVKSTLSTIRQTSELYQKTLETTNSIVKTTISQALKPEYIYNKRITSKLGTPYEKVTSDRITIELFKVNPGVYRGYAMKVKLKDPKAMKMSLGKDVIGGSETTAAAVQRYNAIAGINAGGFADGKGKRYPLSTTIMNGQYLTGFESSFKDLFFVGLDKSGKLIGGKFHNKEDLDHLNPSFGATFVPVLLHNGQKVPIPAQWQTSPARAPRTVIGNYKDDQLLIIVIDGYNENGGSGATLLELQGKLHQLGVRDAYNLDGGGSSSLIFNGRVVNKPSDGSLRPVPTNFLFFK